MALQSFNEYVKVAVEVKASDLHICQKHPVSYRINGSLRNYDDHVFSQEDCVTIASEIMTQAQKDKLSQQLSIDFAYSVKGIARLRVNVYFENNSIAIAVRILNALVPDLKTLGLPECIQEMSLKRHGLILVTGVTGSGKSTTMASLVNEINMNFPYHIITIEEPVEYIYPQGKSVVNQREVGADTLNFSDSLRSALRQDPDVILVGEMRDLETISTAISAAETGHLVLSTLHTIDVAGSIDRIIDIFPPYQQQQVRGQLANVLECVVSQQLIPKADGNGRALATEILICNSAVKNIIREGKTHQLNNTISMFKKTGMCLMDDSVFDLFIKGKISGEDAVYYSKDRADMQKRIEMGG